MPHDVRIGQEHWTDAKGMPAGGTTWGPGLEIRWQNGPEATTHHRGTHVEDLIDAAIGRLEYYQGSRFKCLANSAAIDALRQARHVLEARTMDREERGVEGTHVE